MTRQQIETNERQQQTSDQTRDTFRSRQLQRARERLETLLPPSRPTP